MDDNITIQKAELDDIASMAQLLEELFSIEDDFTFNLNTQINGLTLLYYSKDATLFVAKHNDKVVGMVTMQPLISTAIGGKVGLIEDMIVTKERRGHSIGTKLLDALIEESNRLGYSRLSLGADDRNLKALDFYRQFGFTTSHMGLMYRF